MVSRDVSVETQRGTIIQVIRGKRGGGESRVTFEQDVPVEDEVSVSGDNTVIDGHLSYGVRVNVRAGP